MLQPVWLGAEIKSGNEIPPRFGCLQDPFSRNAFVGTYRSQLYVDRSVGARFGPLRGVISPAVIFEHDGIQDSALEHVRAWLASRLGCCAFATVAIKNDTIKNNNRFIALPLRPCRPNEF